MDLVMLPAVLGAAATAAIAVVSILSFVKGRGSDKGAGPAEERRALAAPEGVEAPEDQAISRGWSLRRKAVAAALIVVLVVVVWVVEVITTDRDVDVLALLRIRLPEAADRKCDFEEVDDKEATATGTCARLPRTRLRVLVDAHGGLDELPDERYEHALRWFDDLQAGVECGGADSLGQQLAAAPIRRIICYKKASGSFFEMYSDEYDLYLIVKHRRNRGLRDVYEFILENIFPVRAPAPTS